MARKTLNGRNMAGTKITGLAPGTASTDAATKGQLDAAIAGVSGGASPYVDGLGDAYMTRPPGGPWIWRMWPGVDPVNIGSEDAILRVIPKDVTPAGPSGTAYDWRSSAFVSNGAPLSDGAEFGAWPGAIGGVPFLAGGASGAKPTVVTIGGAKHLLFDGVDDYMKALTGKVTQPFSWIVIGRQVGDVAARQTGSRVILATAGASGDAGYGAALIQPAGNTTLRMFAGSNGTWSDTTPSGTTNDLKLDADNEAHLFGARFNGASSIGIRDGLRIPVASGSTLVLDPGTDGYDGLVLGANAGLTAFSNFAVRRVIAGNFSADDIFAWRSTPAVATYYGF